jgi:hypothetical protein
VVNCHAIRAITSRFGRLYLIGAIGSAHSTMEEAVRFAAAEQPGEDDDGRSE